MSTDDPLPIRFNIQIVVTLQVVCFLPSMGSKKKR
ncbi:hypothetical protein SAMN05444487_111116 [Marininema mesophilum]|uniref:Uncharacterized protein n=1 Tax=Marininema mesophilum TaxID=1048340 RepID=A0A1H2ZLE1_9BACL|nr:hypothetical protein SAMN05444487_111116 [Marininema mesophilum]